MALQKSYVLENGSQGDYWKIGRGDTPIIKYSIDKKSGKIIVNFSLFLYANETIRNTNPNAYLREYIINAIFNLADYVSQVVPIADLYTYLKNNFKITHKEQELDADGNPVIGGDGLSVLTDVVDFDLIDATDI